MKATMRHGGWTPKLHPQDCRQVTSIPHRTWYRSDRDYLYDRWIFEQAADDTLVANWNLVLDPVSQQPIQRGDVMANSSGLCSVPGNCEYRQDGGRSAHLLLQQGGRSD